MGVNSRSLVDDSQVGVLLGVVEGLRQEIKTLQTTVAEIKKFTGKYTTKHR